VNSVNPEEPKKRPMVPLILVGGGLLVVLVGVLLLHHALSGVNDIALAQEPKGVTAVHARAAPYKPLRRYVGTIDAWISANIGPQLVSAYVETVLVRPGDPVKGQQVFTGPGGCFACHDTSTGNTIVGPSLKGVASRAGGREPGKSADDYLHESILTPNAYVVNGFSAGIMPQSFSKSLSAQQIEDVVAYLETLK